MRSVGLFVEDYGHETFLTALLRRLASECGVDVTIVPSSVRGGHGKVITELKQYVRDLRRGRSDWLDLLVVATDANCKGYSERRNEAMGVTGTLGWQIICAIPDPHIERWLLVDSSAFKNVMGRGCNAPNQKCDRARYKSLLLEAMRSTGVLPPLGGMEYAEDIVNSMDLQHSGQSDDSLGRLLSDLYAQFRLWTKS